MNSIKLILILGFLLLRFFAYPQATQLEPVQNITITDGLAHNGVTAVLHDSKGIFWFSTYDGLNRYDGYSCKTYKNSKNKELFASNRIRTLAEDKNGNLWLGTDEGVSIYNTSRERFKTIYSNQKYQNSLSGPIIRKIIISENGKKILCATEGDGIIIFNDDFTVDAHISPNNITFESLIFFDGIQLDDNHFVFGTSIGLLHLNLNTKTLSALDIADDYLARTILNINPQTFMVARTNGLSYYSFSIKNEQLLIKSGKTRFENFQIVCAAIDKNNNLWLGTAREGIVKVENNTGLFKGENVKLSGFTADGGLLRMSGFCVTNDFGCWASTFNKGVYRFDLNENPFHYYSTSKGQKYAIKTNEILNFGIVDNQRIVVSANGGGSGLFNTETHRFEPLPFPSFKNNEVTGPVFTDSRKNIWLRTQQGVFYLKKGEKTPKLIRVANDSLSNFLTTTPRFISEDKQQNIWIGCVNNVYRLRLDKNANITHIDDLNAHPFFKNKPVYMLRALYVDPHYNFIWLGTEYDGLFRIKNQSDTPFNRLEISQYIHDKNNPESVSSSFVSSIIRLPNGEMWVGTERGGINKVINSDTEPVFESFGESEGLSNNVVKSILYDDDYNLWISTNIGLNKFNTKTQKIRTFRINDGLPFEDFTYPKVHLQNGYLVFGGLNGFIYFKPSEIPEFEKIPQLEFGEVAVFNQTVLPGDSLGNRILYKSHLQNGDQIDLKYNENGFSIELASLHYSTPENHFIRYRLLPFNEQWIQIRSDHRFADYNGLQPGNYELNVQVSNSLNEWGEVQKLNIVIHPPFWATIQAYILYFLLLVLMVLGIIYYILRIDRLQHKLQIEQMEKDNVKEINAAKLRFFSNISHEIKTPLTLISGPVNLLAERFRSNPDVKEKLELIKRQSRKITQLVEQVHDFQKSEAEHLRMEYSVFKFNEFIHEIADDFKLAADTDKKQLILKDLESEIYVSADKDKLEKILNNILNNAFKYTRENDTISVEYNAEDKYLRIKLSDTGRGISETDLPFIFERFYQARNTDEYIAGSGIGLAFTKRLVEMHYGKITAQSKPGEGTTFEISLPVVTSDKIEIQRQKEKEVLLAEDKNVQPDVLETVNPENIKTLADFKETTLFIAEDNTELRRFIRTVLANFFKVKTFRNGKECLDALETEWPEIIVSDVKMPELNGFELCKAVKSNIKTSHIPVILLTACATIDDQIKGLQLGADSYIKKPFEMQHLVTQIETLLLNRKQLRERYQTDFPLTLINTDEHGKDAAFLDKLYLLMAQNLDNQDLDINRFAKELYLNRTQFFKKVKALTNYTPYELLKSYRLKKAAEFLENQFNVSEVYVMTGFKNRTHFSKLFKEKYNITPAKYAAQAKNQKG